MARYVDLHSHFLPGLDDGAKTIESSLQMVRAAASLGFTQLTATPHQRDGMFMPSRAAIDEAFSSVRAAVAEASLDLALGLAAENFWDAVFFERSRSGTLPCYPGGKAFLFEVSPQMMPPTLSAELFSFRVKGLLPVMAHPERYDSVQAHPERAEALGRSAALVVDLGALDGAHGRGAQKAARALVLEGFAHAATTDAHTPEDQRSVAAGMAWIKKHLGPAALERLLDENPRRILAGELP